MESHCTLRKTTADWQADQVNIVNFLRGPCKLAGKYTEEQIHQVCGILAVNSFEARSFVSGVNPVRAIYPQVKRLQNVLTHAFVSKSHLPVNSVNSRFQAQTCHFLSVCHRLSVNFSHTRVTRL